jgi:hypothetical protein
MTSLEVRMRAPPTTQVCPHCQSQMTLAQIMPTSFTDGFESVTYICGQCRSELEQTHCSAPFKPVEHLPRPGQSVWRRGGFERVR